MHLRIGEWMNSKSLGIRGGERTSGAMGTARLGRPCGARGLRGRHPVGCQHQELHVDGVVDDPEPAETQRQEIHPSDPARKGRVRTLLATGGGEGLGCGVRAAPDVAEVEVVKAEETPNDQAYVRHKQALLSPASQQPLLCRLGGGDGSGNAREMLGFVTIVQRRCHTVRPGFRFIRLHFLTAPSMLAHEAWEQGKAHDVCCDQEFH